MCPCGTIRPVIIWCHAPRIFPKRGTCVGDPPTLQEGALQSGLADCYDQGLVRAVGVSNYGAKQLRKVHDNLARRGVPLASAQVRPGPVFFPRVAAIVLVLVLVLAVLGGRW